jgi:hypothetical protein
MTREEAIAYGEDYLKDLISACCHIEEKHKDFVRMAIKALEQQPSEWQQDHAILKAHADGANEVLDRIKEAITALDNAYEDLDGYDPDALGTFKCRVGEVFSMLIAEVEGTK